MSFFFNEMINNRSLLFSFLIISNRVAISVDCKPLRSWNEVSATVERVYVNNSNCDS